MRKHLDNNILSISCLECERKIELTKKVELHVYWNNNIICKNCRCALNVEFGNKCRHHGEDLSKGYCNRCTNNELMDNQTQKFNGYL